MVLKLRLISSMALRGRVSQCSAVYNETDLLRCAIKGELPA